MSDLTYRLAELRSLTIPFTQLVAWPIFFLLTTAISQQPAYFLALILVLAADLFDSSPMNRGLLRDSAAGAATGILAVLLNNQYGVAVGATVTLVAMLRIVQKSKSRQ
jgi:hypothetical protein